MEKKTSNKRRKWNIFIISLFISGFFLSSALTYYFRRAEYLEYIYFEVDSVKITKSLRAFPYDKNGHELSLKTKTFYRSSKIEAGDIIIKESYSDSIKVYRKDSIGNLNVIYKARQSETIFDFLDHIFPLPEKNESN